MAVHNGHITLTKEAVKLLKEARRYYGTCGECGDPATYGSVDGAYLCNACAETHGLS